MTTAQLQTFESLLATWTNHQELRRHGAPVSELADSRRRLDGARLLIRSTAVTG